MLKKILTYSAYWTTATLFFALVLVPTIVFGQGFNNQRIHRKQPSPPVATSTPPVTVPSGFQFGMFNGVGETTIGSISSFFIGDGDSFTQDYQGLKLSGPLFVYWESSLTASQIANGSADSYLKGWATQMKAYGQTIDFAPLDEMNGNWASYYGNTTTYKAAYIHVHNLFAGDTNVKFLYDPNVGNGITSYYPGSSYVDIVGLDGFDFGGQSFAQVFDSSFSAIQSFGKPIWLTSTGVVSSDNQSQYLQDMFAAIKTYNIQGIMYFNYNAGPGQNFVLGSSAISTLKTLL